MLGMTPIRVEVGSGVLLAVQYRPALEAAPVVLFINSLAADHRMWNSVIAALPSELGLITYDTRGHGDSDLGALGFGVERLGHDTLAVLDALKIKQAAICGLSLGGLTGMWLSAEYPARVTTLVLANTAANFPPSTMWTERALEAREKGMTPFVTSTLERWLTPEYRQSHPEKTNAIAQMISTTPAEGYAAGCEVLATTDLTKILPWIDVPVLVIAGAEDSSTSVAVGQAIIDEVGHGTLNVLDAAHLSAVEGSKEFACLLVEAIARTNPETDKGVN